MMKVAVIFYHKHIHRIYKTRWIQKCVDSIAAQTFAEFDVHELDYGGSGTQLAEIPGKAYTHYNGELPNHCFAMNFLLDELFLQRGYDVVFNTNMDDYYAPNRFELQLQCLEMGYDLVSSDFVHIREAGDADELSYHVRLQQYAYGDWTNWWIYRQLRLGHNVIAHPCVAFSRRFWDGNLRYNDLVGWEDLDLWKRGEEAGKRYQIIDAELLYYRIHDKQITQGFRAGG